MPKPVTFNLYAPRDEAFRIMGDSLARVVAVDGTTYIVAICRVANMQGDVAEMAVELRPHGEDMVTAAWRDPERQRLVTKTFQRHGALTCPAVLARIAELSAAGAFRDDE